MHKVSQSGTPAIPIPGIGMEDGAHANTVAAALSI